MYIEKLRLNQFKNHSKRVFDFCSDINCFYGKNGVGKTNVLDALHFVCNGKSYFSRIDQQSIQFEADFAMIEAHVNGQDEATINIGLQRNGKKGLKRNGVVVKRLSDYVGQYPAVMIAPGDIAMLTGHSDDRRRFMDKAIGYSNQVYLKALVKHNKLLEHRNELLKKFFIDSHFDAIALEAIDHQLRPLMEEIYTVRKSFHRDIQEDLTQVYQHIVNSEEELHIEYTSALHQEKPELLLNNHLQPDRYAQRTTQGVHKDDLDILINSVSVKKYGSQGQVKSATIALYLSSYLYLAKRSERTPLLLLDDIFEKIDSHRAKRLLDLISGEQFGQIFITDTSETRLKSKLDEIGAEKKFFNIERE
jgi:DNA replication and repair protein RecF